MLCGRRAQRATRRMRRMRRSGDSSNSTDGSEAAKQRSEHGVNQKTMRGYQICFAFFSREPSVCLLGLLLIDRPRSSFYLRSFEREREIRTCGSVRCRVSFLAVCQAWRYAARPCYSVTASYPSLVTPQHSLVVPYPVAQ